MKYDPKKKNTQNQGKQWFTPKDVADILGIHEETVRRWLRTGELKSIKLSRGPRAKWLIHYDELMKFLAHLTYTVQQDQGGR